ncbi:MAG: hydrogenase maturation protease [Blastochloris sp.]|nr:hydrogenase maturation protease [Blastochloris sp.]
MKTLVLGLGNPILTDDGVGVRVAEAIQVALGRVREAHTWGVGPRCELPANPPALVLPAGDDVDVLEVSVGGLTLMEAMIGYERVILIDAFDAEGVQPGDVQRMTLADLRGISPTQHSASPHDASLPTAFALGQQMGLALPAASNVIIYAVGVANIIDFSDEPTPAVAAVIPAVTAAVLAELQGE